MEERHEALLHLDPVVREGEEEVGARVWVDDGLERQLRFAQLQARLVVDRVVPGDREKLPITAIAGLK
jgi:hypothetical protein